MTPKKDEAYFRQYINKIFTLPSGDTKYALVDVKKVSKIYYFVYIAFENYSSGDPSMEECKTLLKTINILNLPLQNKCEECGKECEITKTSEQNKLCCPECYHKSNCQFCDECGIDIYWEYAKKKDDMMVCEECYSQV